MIVIPFQSKILTEPFSIELLLRDTLGNEIKDGDVLVIASKVVSISEGEVILLSSLNISEEAWALATEFNMSPAFVRRFFRKQMKFWEESLV